MSSKPDDALDYEHPRLPYQAIEDEFDDWSHESDCDCARRCNHLPGEVCERCSDG